MRRIYWIEVSPITGRVRLRILAFSPNGENSFIAEDRYAKTLRPFCCYCQEFVGTFGIRSYAKADAALKAHHAAHRAPITTNEDR